MFIEDRVDAGQSAQVRAIRHPLPAAFTYLASTSPSPGETEAWRNPRLLSKQSLDFHGAAGSILSPGQLPRPDHPHQPPTSIQGHLLSTYYVHLNLEPRRHCCS